MAVLPLDAAVAQSIGTACNSYYPIRQQGAACYGANVGWSMTRPDGVVVCCVAQPRASVGGNTGGTIYGPSEGQRIAAGLALGIEGVQLLGAILGLIMDMSSSGGGSNDAPLPPQKEWEDHKNQVAAERGQALASAKGLNAAGLEAARAGNYRAAYGNFKRAAEMASVDAGVQWEYRKNMYAMDSYLHLQQALAFQAEGKLNEASTNFQKASYWASHAQRNDLSMRITAYQTQLNQSQPNQPAARQQKAPTQQCQDVNGTLMCN